MHDYVDENHQFHIVQTAESSSSRSWQVPDDHNDEKLEVTDSIKSTLFFPLPAIDGRVRVEALRTVPNSI